MFSEQRGDFLNLFKPRGATAAVFEPVWRMAEGSSTLAAVCVVNVHLNLGCDAQRDSQASEAVALGRRTAAAAATASGCSSSVGVAVLGDFNAHEQEGTVIRMAAEHGFVDAIAASGCAGAPRLTWSAANPLTHGTLREPDGCIDYVFFNPGPIRARAARTVFCDAPYLSDHFGVLAELSLASSVPPPLLTRPDWPGLGCASASAVSGSDTPGSVATTPGDVCSLPSSGCSTVSGDDDFQDGGDDRDESSEDAHRPQSDLLQWGVLRRRWGTDDTEVSHL